MKKFRLTATILAFALVIGIMGFGVYAASRSTFTISNHILFTPNGDQAYFSAVVSTQRKATAETATFEEFGTPTTVSAPTSSAVAEIPEGEDEVTIGNFAFNDYKVYQITLTIQNLNASFAMTVEISDIASNANFSVVCNKGEINAGVFVGSNLIAANTSEVITLTYTITNFSNVIDVTQNLNVELSLPPI